MSKFERATGGPKNNTTDAVGTVRVVVSLADPKTPGYRTQGNISKTVSVREARVSEVAKAIERALFGDDQ